MLRQIDLRCIELPGYLGHCDEMLTTTLHLFHDSTDIVGLILAHTQTTTSLIVDILPPQIPVGDQVRGLEGLCAHDQLTSILLALVGEICRECLSGGSHQTSHGRFYLSNCLTVHTLVIVSIDHDKFKFLYFFEVIGHFEAGLEVGVQIVVNQLSRANFLPLLVLCLCVEPAHWV